MTNAEEAAVAWIEATLDSGNAIPAPTTIEDVRRDADYDLWLTATIEVDRSSVVSTGSGIPGSHD